MTGAAQDMLLFADQDWTIARDDRPRPLFANAEWVLTGDGLEHRGNGYFIPREELGHRRPDGLWTWPIHMAEKLWCAPALFAEAFMQAVRAYGLEADAGLALSFHDAGRIRGEQAGHTALAARPDAPPAPVPSGRWRSEDARAATAHPWRPNRVAQAGLSLLQWLRFRADGG